MTLMHNCLLGLQEYLTGSKLVAVVFIAVFIFFVLREKNNIVIYSAVCAALLIFPPTAALISVYASAHTEYVWLWAMLPVLAFSSYFLTLLVLRISGTSKLLCCAIVLLALLLCGDFGTGSWSDGTPLWLQAQTIDSATDSSEDSLLDSLVADPSESTLCASLLEHLGGMVSDGAIAQDACIWGSQDIMEYVRVYAPDFTTIYGRGIRDDRLGAFTYDDYCECYYMLYEYTVNVTNYGAFDFMSTSRPIYSYESEEYETTSHIRGKDIILLTQTEGANLFVFKVPAEYDRDALDKIVSKLHLNLEEYFPGGDYGYVILY